MLDMTAAYYRGRTLREIMADIAPVLLQKPPDELTEAETAAIIAAGRAVEDKLYYFKRTHEDMAGVLLAAHQPFVFNGTNITEQMRGKWTRLFEQYHARVRMVWLETDRAENLRRNADRQHAVPERKNDAAGGT